MGTRADFYVGRGPEAEWLGSLPFDGYAISPAIAAACDEATFRAAVAEELTEENRATTPDMGWPWPWETSATTDFAWAFDGHLWWSCFGGPWHAQGVGDERAECDRCDAGSDDNVCGERATFPDMSARKSVTYGPRSGLIVVSAPSAEGRRP